MQAPMRKMEKRKPICMRFQKLQQGKFKCTSIWWDVLVVGAFHCDVCEESCVSFVHLAEHLRSLMLFF